MLDCEKTAGVVTPVCPLCGGDGIVPAFERDGQHYRRCGACALLFAPAGRDNANFQTSIDDLEPAYLQYLDEGPADAWNLDDAIRWIEEYADLNNPAVRLLDVGAGSGKFVKRIRDSRPCVVSGIEPSTILFERYRLGELGVDPVALPDLAGRLGATFDVVTVLDVIEHVVDARGFLEALAAVTKPGGVVFLSTPDADGVLARILGRRWHHANAYHFCLYGRRGLAEAARRHGFDVVYAGHRAKRMSLDYLWRYGRDFLLARQPRTRDYRASRLVIPVNLGDTVSVVWRRRTADP